MLAAGSLELKSEKQSAHSDLVRSVAFSPDGKTIVSGSNDKTIKVWDAGALALTPSKPYIPQTLYSSCACGSIPGAQKAEEQSAHSDWVRSVVFSAARDLLLRLVTLEDSACHSAAL